MGALLVGVLYPVNGYIVSCWCYFYTQSMGTLLVVGVLYPVNGYIVSCWCYFYTQSMGTLLVVGVLYPVNGYIVSCWCFIPSQWVQSPEGDLCEQQQTTPLYHHSNYCSSTSSMCTEWSIDFKGCTTESWHVWHVLFWTAPFGLGSGTEMTDWLTSRREGPFLGNIQMCT